jgi:hypothetical protein
VRGVRSTAVDVVVMLLAAYLQAAAMVRCARAVITPPPTIESGAPPAEPTGPTPPRATVRVSSAPAAPPGCPGFSASIVSLSPDVALSLATLRSERGSELVQIGSRTGELSVAAIREREVVLTDHERACRVPLGRAPAPVEGEAPAGPVSVPRALRDRVLERPERLLAGARLVPVRAAGAPVAVSVEQLAPGSLRESLGLRTGDRIRSVNGWTFAGPADSVRAWTELSRAEHFAISVERAGRVLELHVALD